MVLIRAGYRAGSGLCKKYEGAGQAGLNLKILRRVLAAKMFEPDINLSLLLAKEYTFVSGHTIYFIKRNKTLIIIL